uniref:Glycosyltransferase n=1 Tax=Desulfobacca acetoxidans TaxID=60893 RepID=A0A7V4LCQ9_9BACT
MIPITQPTLHDFEAVVAEFRQAWESRQVTTGVFTRRFEEAVEAKLGVPHAVMVQSCTAGLMLVLRALDLKGEVIMPAFTWTATAHAAVWNGLTPVFADIVPGTYTLDPQAVEEAVTPDTAAVIPVNVFGCPPDYEAFARLGNRHGLPVIYDSAQGLGSRYQSADGVWHWAGGFGAAEVFILPSHQENFGIAVAEALACGVPVLISNKVNIWREIQADGAGLVDDDGLEGTERLIRRWFETPKTKKNRMRANAGRCFDARFEIRRAAESLASTLEGIVGGKNSPPSAGSWV